MNENTDKRWRVKKVLDSWAMLAWLQDEKPASDKVQDLLNRAETGDLELSMNLINVGEVYYRLVRSKGEETARAFKRIFSKMPIRLVKVTCPSILMAASLKGRYPIAYADAFAAADAEAAEAEKCPLVTGDPELRVLEGLIDLEWLG